jgi:hypothetical protein
MADRAVLVVAANLPKLITINSGPELWPPSHAVEEGNAMPLIRWHAIAYYRTNEGTVDKHHDLEELLELHDLIERGPHWTRSRRSKLPVSITSPTRT